MGGGKDSRTSPKSWQQTFESELQDEPWLNCMQIDDSMLLAISDPVHLKLAG